MTKKSTLLMLTIIILLIPHAFASFNDSIRACYSFDSGPQDSAGNNDLEVFGDAHGNSSAIVGNGSYSFDGTGDYLLNSSTTLNFTSGNWTICEWFKKNSGLNNALFVLGNSPDYAGINVQGTATTKMDYLLSTSGSSWAGYTSSTGDAGLGLWHHFCMMREGANYSLYINGTLSQTRVMGTGNIIQPIRRLLIGQWYDGTPSMDFNGNIDNLMIWNRSLSASEIQTLYTDRTNCTNLSAPGVVLDNTPPEITYYNLVSSENGCTAWNTDKNSSCATSSATPTINFTTNEDASCAVAGGLLGSYNINYSDMGASRRCEGAAAGQGTQNHLCTLNNSDELVYDISYLYISCTDLYSNQNSTSTSGALRLNITGLENTARNLIDLSMRNALLSDYSVLTDQPVYARNSANSHTVGIFDKVAKKLNKIWAFNYVGTSESHISMFNLSPVLYNLEFANITSGRISNLTELMINSTK